MTDITINLQKSNKWKFLLTIAINFISSKGVKECVMRSKSNNIECTPYDNQNEVVDEFFDSRLSRYQISLEKLMRRSVFIFDSVPLLYYRCHKINFKRGGSYIDFPGWIKKKRTKINPKNDYERYSEYAAAIALNHKTIDYYPERVSNIKPFINSCNWKGINYPSKSEDWKRLEKTKI